MEDIIALVSGFTAPPALVSPVQQPFQYPNIAAGGNFAPPPGVGAPPAPFQYNIPPGAPGAGNHSPDTNAPPLPGKNNLDNLDESSGPPPYFPPDKPPLTQSAPPPAAPASNVLDLPDLPAVPSDTPLGGNTPQDPGDDDDIDFDDLTKRFEALKKKK